MQWWILFICVALTRAETECPIKNCKEWDNPKPQCASCPAGSTLSSDLTSCLESPDTKCLEWRGVGRTAKCIRCTVGYAVYIDGLCQGCPANCKRCHYDFGPKDFVCDECKDNYGFVDGECRWIHSGEYKDVLHGFRFQCQENAECKDVGLVEPVITKCKTGYIIRQNPKDLSKYTCVKGGQKSVDCAPGYTYIKTANHYQAPCQKCTPTKPSGSDHAYYLDEEGNCKPCTEKHALGCWQSDGIWHVTGCEAGYEIYHETLDSDRECVRCPDGCVKCQNDKAESGQLKCRGCRVGYYEQNGDCLSCPENCQRCDQEGRCKECDIGYADVAIDDFYCVRCEIEHCRQCNSKGRCQKCEPGWYENFGRCFVENCKEVGDDGSCVKCKEGWEAVDGRCEARPEHCVQKDGSDSCEKCADGYGIKEGENPSKCHECGPSCSSCTLNEANDVHCSGCASGYYFNGSGECSPCPDNCVTCDEMGECSKCEVAYALDNSGSCALHGLKHCTEATINALGLNSCSACEEGYVLEDDERTCVRCPVHCAECELRTCGNDKCMRCSTCSDGYVQAAPDNTDVSHWCAPCPDECLSCKFDSGDMLCETCVTRGYRMDRKRCERCPDRCLECDRIGCKECEQGYVWDGKNCVECRTKIDFCSTCHKTNDGEYVCEACLGHYALNISITGSTQCDFVDGTIMDCLSEPVIIPKPRCKLDGCVNGTFITADYQCAINCYFCNSSDPSTRCNSSTFTTQSCTSGICLVKQKVAATQGAEQGGTTEGGTTEARTTQVRTVVQAGCAPQGSDCKEEGACGEEPDKDGAISCCCQEDRCNIRWLSPSRAANSRSGYLLVVLLLVGIGLI